jgi:hypothetical protein
MRSNMTKISLAAGLAVVASVVTFGSALASHNEPAATATSSEAPLLGPELADSLGIKLQDSWPDGCNSWIEMVDQGEGYCLDGVPSAATGLDVYVLGTELRGSVPTQQQIDRVQALYTNDLTSPSAQPQG